MGKSPEETEINNHINNLQDIRSDKIHQELLKRIRPFLQKAFLMNLKGRIKRSLK